jgi:hypothetical protein
MTKHPEEFDGGPTLSADTAVAFDTLSAKQDVALEISAPKTVPSLEDSATNDNCSKLPVTNKAIRRAAKELIRQQGAWAFKVASDKAQEAAKAGDVTVQRSWRRIGWAVLEMRPSFGRGGAVTLTS